ncbi:MAG: putative bifunctional diguanylate cyclase/phosphodiesterase, partial [Devosia sp.]
MTDLKFYAAISRFGRLNYRAKIMIMAFLGTHVPLLALIGFFVFNVSSDMGLVWTTLAVALVATLVGTGVTLFVLNQLLAPVLATSRALRLYGETRKKTELPQNFTDEAGTLMADAGRTMERLEQSLVALETTELVTGLPNRRKFTSELTDALRRSPQGALAVVTLRLRDHGRLMASYDQRRLDAMMRLLADRLAGACEPDAFMARTHADAFSLILPAADVDDVSARAARLSAALCAETPFEGIVLCPDIATGVALYPDDALDATALLDHAAAAATLSRSEAIVAFHAPAIREEARRRFELEQELRRAVAENQFELAYQPVVDLRAGRATASEALIRWRHPDKGLIAPGLFIPTAERSGLIDDIGRWVIREACAQAGRWQEGEAGALKVAINLSARQFLDRDLTGLLDEAVADSGISPERIEIELTESAAMVDYEHTRNTFTRLRNAGFSIAIDDFGTGYASMSYLRRLPFNKLKIDREFVSHVDTAADAQAICGAMITLAQGLGLEVLAEGAERPEEVRWLSERGCALFQGYYFAR